MAAQLLYLDSSALVKLVIEEQESSALAEHVEGWPQRVTSVVAAVEVSRAARRVGGAVAVDRARALLNGLHLLALDDRVVAAAATLDPVGLSSLDAMHLASALSIGEALGGFAAYDAALGYAAAAAGLTVLAPR